MRRTILIICAVALVFTAAWLIWCKGKKPDKAKALSDEELLDRVSNAVVMITAGEKHASGVIVNIDEKRVDIVTAGHLMEGYEQGIVSFNCGLIGFGNVKYISDNPDVCVLSFDRNALDEGAYEYLTATSVSLEGYRKLKLDDEVLIIGSAVGTAANATIGTVKSTGYYVPDFDAEMLFLYADTMPGLSGCPIYDRYGRLVAILAGGSEYGEAVCVKAEDILDCLEQVN